MNMSSCFLCFKTIDEVNSTSEESGEVPLLTKFLKFVQNYLQVGQLPSSEQLLGMWGGDGKELFCEKCELSVITPICQVYSQLLATQLRLSWELGQLEKLLLNSQSFTKLDSLANRNGIINNNQLNNFRRSLTENCRLKRKEMLPQVMVQRFMKLPTAISDFSQNQSQPVFKIENESFEGRDNDDDVDFDPLDVDTSNSLHSQGRFDEINTLLIDENATSSEGSSVGGDLEMDVEHTTVKIEIVQDSQQFLAKSDDGVDDDEEDLDPNYSPDSPPAVKKTKKRTEDCEEDQFQCPKCPKVFTTARKLQIHVLHVHGARKYRCDHCKKAFKTSTNLSRHVLSIHTPQPQTCERCGKVCKSMNALRMHLFWSHSEPQRPKCPKCGKSLSHRQHVKRHLLTCSGKREPGKRKYNKPT